MSSVQWGDVATWVSAAATVVALIYVAIQVKDLRAERRLEQTVELDGVAVLWQARNVPTTPDEDGWSTADYTFTAYNPGRLPITDVVVTVDIPCEVRRVHYDGQADEPMWHLTLTTPVIRGGGGEREWRRALSVRWEEKTEMRDVTATITFVSVLERRQQSNVWGARRSQSYGTR